LVIQVAEYGCVQVASERRLPYWFTPSTIECDADGGILVEEKAAIVRDTPPSVCRGPNGECPATPPTLPEVGSKIFLYDSLALKLRGPYKISEITPTCFSISYGNGRDQFFKRSAFRWICGYDTEIPAAADYNARLASR
jgi:hypothetical protein